MELTPLEAQKAIEACMFSNIVPLVLGQPGTGKSAMVKAIADKYKMDLIDVRLSMCAPEDLMGLPTFENGKAKFLPFNDVFPIEGTVKNPNGVILFLDEFTSANKGIQAPVYRLVEDREVGQYKLDSKVYIVCAGNRLQDKAIVNQLSTALVSRVCMLEVKPNLKDFLDKGLEWQIHPYVIGYLNCFNAHFNTFDPDEDILPFACPRTWYKVSKLLPNLNFKDKDKQILSESIISGLIGEKVSHTFSSFIINMDSFIKPEDIAKDPLCSDIPTNKDQLYGVICSICCYEGLEDNLEEFCTYIDRISDHSMCLLFYKMVINFNKKLLSNSKFQKRLIPYVKELRS